MKWPWISRVHAKREQREAVENALRPYQKLQPMIVTIVETVKGRYRLECTVAGQGKGPVLVSNIRTSYQTVELAKIAARQLVCVHMFNQKDSAALIKARKAES